MARNFLTTLFFTLLLILYNAEAANQEVIADDGREVLLKEDGSWAFSSTDRFANTKDGRRVRLKEDGSWQYTGNATLKTKEQLKTSDLDIKLNKVVIETYKKKMQKSVRVKTQTVFYVSLGYSSQAKTNISINKNDISLIEVKDSSGKKYPVLSIEPNAIQIKPDSSTTLVIRAEKSPSIFGNVKKMEIVFKKGMLGLEAPVTLSQRTIDFEEKDVGKFE